MVYCLLASSTWHMSNKWNSKARTCSKTVLGNADGLWRIAYLLKIGAKSFRDGSQDICKHTESNLGPFAGFKADIIQKQALFQFLYWTTREEINYELELTELCSCSVFSFVLVSSPPVTCCVTCPYLTNPYLEIPWCLRSVSSRH